MNEMKIAYDPFHFIHLFDSNSVSDETKRRKASETELLVASSAERAPRIHTIIAVIERVQRNTSTSRPDPPTATVPGTVLPLPAANGSAARG